MYCGLARCCCAKPTRFDIIPVVSFSHVHTISSRLNVILLIYRLAAGYPLCHHNTLNIKENMALNFERLVCFFWSWRWRWLPRHWLSLGFRIIHKYPSFITTNYRIQQTWFILSALQKSKPNSLRRSFCLSDHFWNHFYKNLSHVHLLP